MILILAHIAKTSDLLITQDITLDQENFIRSICVDPNSNEEK